MLAGSSCISLSITWTTDHARITRDCMLKFEDRITQGQKPQPAEYVVDPWEDFQKISLDETRLIHACTREDLVIVFTLKDGFPGVRLQHSLATKKEKW